MVTVNLSPYTAESEAIARKLRMAEALGQKAAQPLEMPTMPGVRISPYAGLAKMLESYTAGRDERAARAESKALGEKYQKDISADYSSLLKGLTPTAAVPEGPSSFTPNVDERDVAENPRMQMMPETDYEGGIIPAGQPGAGNFGITPGTPAIPATTGKLTAEGFSAMQTPEGRQLFMAQLLAQNKPKEPIKLGKDDVLLDPDTRKPIYQPPVEKKKPIVVGNTLVDPDTLKAVFTGDRAPVAPPSMVSEYTFAKTADGGNFKVSFQDFVTARAVAGRSPSNVTYGSPISALDASGKPVFIQPGRAGGAPAVMEGFTPPAAKLKDVPPTVNTAMTQNQIVLNKLDRIDNLLVKTPDATGILKGITPGIILNRFDKEGTALRAALTELAATKVHDLSGAAVSASEFGRLKPFLPQPTDDSDTIKTKLAGMKAEIQDIMNATNSIYSEDQGYKPIPNLAPKPAETPPISALKEGQTTTFKNGQSWTLQQGKPLQVK